MRGVSRRRGACGDYHAKLERAEHGGGVYRKLTCVGHRGSASADIRYHRRKAKRELAAAQVLAALEAE
jgi:hypothetical protein